MFSPLLFYQTTLTYSSPEFVHSELERIRFSEHFSLIFYSFFFLFLLVFLFFVMSDYEDSQNKLGGNGSEDYGSNSTKKNITLSDESREKVPEMKSPKGESLPKVGVQEEDPN